MNFSRCSCAFRSLKRWFERFAIRLNCVTQNGENLSYLVWQGKQKFNTISEANKPKKAKVLFYCT